MIFSIVKFQFSWKLIPIYPIFINKKYFWCDFIVVKYERERERDVHISNIKHETFKKYICCTSRLFQNKKTGLRFLQNCLRSTNILVTVTHCSLKFVYCSMIPWLSRLIIKSLWSTTMRFLFNSNSRPIWPEGMCEQVCIPKTTNSFLSY